MEIVAHRTDPRAFPPRPRQAGRALRQPPSRPTCSPGPSTAGARRGARAGAGSVNSRGRVSGLLTGLALLFLAGVATGAVQDTPVLSSYVVDGAELLTTAARVRIMTKLNAYEERTNNHITVLTTPVFSEVDTSSSAALKLWNQSEPRRDHTVLLLIVKNDNKLRFKISSDLADLLSDAVRDKIMRRILWPNLQANNYDRGIEEVVAAIIGQLDGLDMVSALPEIDESAKPRESFPTVEDSNTSLFNRIVSGVVVFLVLGVFAYVTMTIEERMMALIFYLFMIPFWAVFPAVFVFGWKVGLILCGAYVVLVPPIRMLLIAVKLVKSNKGSFW